MVEDAPVVPTHEGGSQTPSGELFTPPTPVDTPVTEDTIKEYKSVTISGKVPLENWTQLFASFVNVLKNNGLEIEVKFKAKTKAGHQLTENSVTVKNVKESASQLGLKFEAEE